MTESLVDRIKAALDETERVANAATDHMLNGGELGFNSDDLPDPIRRHIFRWTPAHVLPLVEATRKILDDILDERHEVVEDCWYTCPAATEEREGETSCNQNRLDDTCTCGRDKRVQRRLSMLAEALGIEADHE